MNVGSEQSEIYVKYINAHTKKALISPARRRSFVRRPRSVCLELCYKGSYRRERQHLPLEEKQHCGTFVVIANHFVRSQ